MTRKEIIEKLTEIKELTETDEQRKACNFAIEIIKAGTIYEYTDCEDCALHAPKGHMNTRCFSCMHAYGVHTQKANYDGGDYFPKYDRFEPKGEEE